MARRKAICARDITAGPGTCFYWWESCPAKVSQCFNRFIRKNGGEIDMTKAEEWAAARDRALEPQPKLDLGEAA